MNLQFQNRSEAGALLARKLSKYSKRSNVHVVTFPTPAVHVAYEVAIRLDAPLQVFLIRPLTAPGEGSLSFGVVTSGGVRVLDERVIESLQISDDLIETIADREQQLLEGEEQLLHETRGFDVTGSTVILIDDGISDGVKMIGVISALRKLGVHRLVIATPVIARSLVQTLSKEADEVFSLITPLDDAGADQWYVDSEEPTTPPVHELRKLVSDTEQNLTEAVA